MSEFHFGTGRGEIKPTAEKRVDRIARKHDATFVNVKLPGEGWRYWFSTRSYGFPFDDATARAVLADLEAAGLADASGLVDSIKR